MDLRENIYNIIKSIQDKEDISIFLKNIDTGEELISFKANEKVISASIIKVPIMLAIFNEVKNDNINLDTKIMLKKEDILGDTDIFDLKEKEYSVKELVKWMITKSDNTSTNVLIKFLGFEKINNFFETLGLKNTKLERLMLDEAAIQNGKNNYTSLDDMYRVFKLLFTNNILNTQLCQLAIDILYNQRISNQISRYIPELRFAHKTGGLNNLNHDVGVFEINEHRYFLGICIYNAKNKNGDRHTVGKMGKIIYDYLKSNKV